MPNVFLYNGQTIKTNIILSDPTVNLGGNMIGLAAGSSNCKATTGIGIHTTTPSSAIFDGSPVVLGVKFRTTVNAYVTAVRLYMQANYYQAHQAAIYTYPGGVKLMQFTLPAEDTTLTGWVDFPLPTPLLINGNTTYILAVLHPASWYPANNTGFASAITNGIISGLANGTDGTNGIYDYSASMVMPTSNFLSSDYFIDLTVQENGLMSGVAAGSGSDNSTLSGATGGNALAGSIAGIAADASTLSGQGALSGNINAPSTQSGTLSGIDAAAGIIAGVGSQSGNITAKGALSGSIAGNGAQTGALNAPGSIAGTISGSSGNNSTISALGSLSGSIAGTAGQTATETAKGALAGTIAGTSTATITNAAPSLISGTASGSGSASAALTGTIAGSGTTGGSSTTIAQLIALGLLSAVTACQGNASAAVNASGKLIGSSAGLAAQVAALMALVNVAGHADGISGSIGGLSVFTIPDNIDLVSLINSAVTMNSSISAITELDIDSLISSAYTNKSLIHA